MKQIVLVLGTGLNERGWAKDFSKFGRVTLIQIGLIEHVEIWEHGQRIFCGPETNTARRRRWDDACLGFFVFLRTIQLIRRYSKGIKIDLLITGYYSSGFAALLLRSLGKVQRMVFFLTDYLPPTGSWLVRLHRRLTESLVRQIARGADEVWALSPRIKAAYANPHHFVVPMHINTNPFSGGARDAIGYIGYPSYDHALDILFSICKKHSLRLNVIGDSPYLQSIKHLAPADAIFHGLLNDEEKIGAVFANCFCGYAIYRNIGPTSYSYYGFPSKTLYCFASNVPVVITEVAHFNENFEKNGVGRVVKPTEDEIEKAVLQLRDNYADYSRAIDRFRSEWNAGAEAFHHQRMSVLLNLKPNNPGSNC